MRVKIHLLVILFFCIWNTKLVSAQGLISVKHYSIEDGLSQSKIQSILQDKEGYIWLGTWNGLEKFDGYTFKNYKSYPTDKVRLQHNRLQDAKMGHNNTIWCETYDYKIYLFDIAAESYIDVFSYHPDIKQCESINKMIPLENGILWVIGNDGSLWRIDEKRYKEKEGLIYIPPFSVPEHGNQIYSIALDQYNNEWVLTNRGHWVYGKNKLSGKRKFKDAVRTDKLFFLAEDTGKLAVYNSDHQIQDIEIPHPIQSFYELSLLQDKKLVLTTERGILIFDYLTKSFQYITIDEKAEPVRPEQVFQARNGTLWMFNGREKVMQCNMNDGVIHFIDYPTTTQHINNSFIHEDDHGTIWILPPLGELSFYNSQTQRFEQAYSYDKGNKIYYQAVGMNYMINSHHNLWARCGSGFDKISFSNGSSQYISNTDGIEVRGLFIDSNGYLWVASKNQKVEIYDDNQNYLGNLSVSGNIAKDKQLSLGADIYCFFEDKQHRIWMGSRRNGLYVATQGINGYKLTQFTHQPNDSTSINSNSIYSICEDLQGRIWIGTYGGGVNLVEGTFPNLHFIHKGNRLKLYPEVQCSKVRTMRCTSDGIIMAGTMDGLLTFSTNFEELEKIIFYHNKSEESRSESLSNNDVFYTLETKSKEIYVITYSGGLSKMISDNLLSEQIQFFHYNKKNGLPSDMTYSITEDKKGYLWISFENSICKFDPKKHQFENYDRFNLHTYLPITEVPSVLDNDDKMYIGTYEGTLQLDLKKLQKSSFIPPIVFTKADIRKNDELSISSSILDNTLKLKADERNVSISFAALDFTNKEKLEYAYRLRGVSEKWTYINQNHTASFVNLSAGNFILEVKSTNGDGVWVENITALAIHVEPTFWETKWAWMVYAFLILITIFIVSGILVYTLNLRRKVDFEQQLTNLKLRFFTDISHELRTPLTLIANPIEEVINNEPLSQEGHENMVTAKRNTDRMLKLINQILDFRKIQNNKMKLYIEQVDVLPLFKQTFENFSSIAHQKDIHFELNCPQEYQTIYTDIDKLEKILFNLLSNAFKYTPNGKSILITVTFDKNALNFSIKDEGKGFDLYQIDTLFKRFETLGQKDNNLSSGIGLSLVKELVHLLHGSIKVDSTLGKGSVFEVSLPINYDAFKSDENIEFIMNDSQQTTTSYKIPENTSPTEGADKNIDILIVEDNEELRHFLVNMLQKDYRILEAADGKSGLDLTVSAMPDLIISDIMMPVMDGIELLEAVKKNHNISHIPFILLSAKASLDDRIQGLEYGADDYITKPFSSSYLKARISSLLKQRDALRSHFTRKSGDISPSIPQITHFDETFINQIVQAVEEGLQNPDFKIEDLADSMNLSRTVFYRKIRSLLGVSPIDFVRDMRIKRAVQLLDSEAYTISEVAYMSGFSSPQYFNRVFKNIMNCTPTEYKTNK